MTDRTTPDERRALGAALVAEAPWVEATELGPRAVAAGQCDRCGARPRLLPTCGPTSWLALCRECGLEVGTEGWCEGHRDDAEDALRWARDLPVWWGDAVVLAWVASGEVASPVGLTLHEDLPTGLRAALPSGDT